MSRLLRKLAALNPWRRKDPAWCKYCAAMVRVRCNPWSDSPSGAGPHYWRECEGAPWSVVTVAANLYGRLRAWDSNGDFLSGDPRPVATGTPAASLDFMTTTNPASEYLETITARRVRRARRLYLALGSLAIGALCYLRA